MQEIELSEREEISPVPISIGTRNFSERNENFPFFESGGLFLFSTFLLGKEKWIIACDIRKVN